MRKTLSLLLFVALMAGGCGNENAGALFADIQYATRCEVTRGCGAPEQRDICGINRGMPCIMGNPNASVSCAVTEMGSSRTLTFSASQGPDFAFGMRQAEIAVSGGVAGGGNCAVTVTEGPNVFEGTCGAGTPTAAQPCQVTNVRWYLDEGNATVEGDIFCEMLPNRASPGFHIEVTALGTTTTAMMTPGRFRIANCSGLELSE